MEQEFNRINKTLDRIEATLDEMNSDIDEIKCMVDKIMDEIIVTGKQIGRAHV